MNKEIGKEIGIEEATRIAQKARRVFVDGFAKMGHPLTPGSINAVGQVITEEQFKEMCDEIDRAGLQAILGRDDISLQTKVN